MTQLSVLHLLHLVHLISQDEQRGFPSWRRPRPKSKPPNFAVFTSHRISHGVYIATVESCSHAKTVFVVCTYLHYCVRSIDYLLFYPVPLVWTIILRRQATPLRGIPPPKEHHPHPANLSHGRAILRAAADASTVSGEGSNVMN